MTPHLYLFILLINLALITEQFGQGTTVPIIETFTNHRKLNQSRFSTDGIEYLQKSNPSSFQTAIEFQFKKETKTFNKLDYLSVHYLNKYQNSFNTSTPLLFSSNSKGNYLVNLLTTETPILKFHTREGNFRFQNNKSKKDIWFHERENKPLEDYCFTTDSPIKKNMRSFQKNNNLNLPTVSVYLEIDYYTYQEFNGDEKAINDWAILLFAEVASVYAIDDIPIQLEDVFIWTEEDPFDLDSGAVVVLNQFNEKILTEGPSADAHLMLSTRYIAGIANLESLCQYENQNNPEASVAIATGVSPIPSFNSSYNWSVYVLAHELGHILGSRHTHACVWIDGSQALDNCGYPEGSCNFGSQPSQNEGTIMSYCHNWAHIGINFANGFGEEPSQYIKNNVLNMNCSYQEQSLNSCISGTGCDDLNECTTNDVIIDENCLCQGVLIDFNMNDICDLYDDCPLTLVVDSVTQAVQGHLAQQSLIGTTEIKSGQTVYFSAGQEVILNEGFEVNHGATFESQIFGCDNSN